MARSKPAEEWETHLTVHLGDTEAQWNALEAWAQSHNWKAVHIVLSQGGHASQPMLTRHTENASEADALRAAHTARAALQNASFIVSRVKVEAAPWNRCVPVTAGDAQNLPAGWYFEHHVKLLLPVSADTQLLTETAQKHAAHLSRNARRIRSDEQTERFVTQRCFGVGRNQATERLNALLDALAPLFPVLECEAEFVVYDSNLSLDAGWIDAQGTKNHV